MVVRKLPSLGEPKSLPSSAGGRDKEDPAAANGDPRYRIAERTCIAKITDRAFVAGELAIGLPVGAIFAPGFDQVAGGVELGDKLVAGIADVEVAFAAGRVVDGEEGRFLEGAGRGAGGARLAFIVGGGGADILFGCG